MVSENVQIALIVALPTTLTAIGGIIIPLIGMYKHRNHEATSDDTNARLTILLNGGLQRRIEEAVARHVGETLK